jgi:hypothetical protein
MAKAGCQCDPVLKEQWGCIEPAPQVVWIDIDENEYFTCPLKCITENVTEWFQEYKFYKELGNTLRYHELPAKWLDALSIYSSYLSRYQEEQEALSKKASSGLNALRAGKNQR